jgi:hypothetical protein
MPLQTTPDSIDQKITDFCAKISPGSIPVFLSTEHVHGAKALNCFENVNNYVKLKGGDIQYGWLIWEWPNVMIEAEFHAVWKPYEGKLVDITPNDTIKVLFLPDNKMGYERKQVNNIRKALRNDKLIRRYIKSSNKLFAVMNKGNLAGYVGELELTPHMKEMHIQNHKIFLELIKQEYGDNWKRVLAEEFKQFE